MTNPRIKNRLLTAALASAMLLTGFALGASDHPPTEPCDATIILVKDGTLQGCDLHGQQLLILPNLTASDCDDAGGAYWESSRRGISLCIDPDY